MAEKVCPLCGRKYPATAKVCPLKHCPNCGSTDIDFTDEMHLLFILGILPGSTLFVYTLFFPETFAVYLIIFGVACLIACLIFGLYKCDDCGAKIIIPVKNVKLKLKGGSWEEYLKKLEELYREGRISDRMYWVLREEYERKIKGAKGGSR